MWYDKKIKELTMEPSDWERFSYEDISLEAHRAIVRDYQKRERERENLSNGENMLMKRVISGNGVK